MGFLSKAKVTAGQLIEQSVQFLSEKFDSATQVFTPASPFGQLLIVISNLMEMMMTYLSHAVEQLNLSTVRSAYGVHGLARLTGHDAYRGGSAKGIIQLKLNTSAAQFINGTYVKIPNYSKLLIEESGCTYFMNIASDYLRLNTDNTNYVNVHIIEGDREQQSFVSDGTALQSFNPIVNGMTDNDNVRVTVNGREWKKVDSLYDMNTDEECFICKTSVSVGLSIFFGNGNFGKIPPSGSEIVVSYIKTSGLGGNLGSKNLTYKFSDMGIDESGQEVDLNQVLLVNTVQEPILGSDYEDPEFTKLMAPHMSKSFVLATPENYISYLSRYNQFKFIDAFNTKDDGNINDDNVTYLRMLPDVKRRFTTDVDFFSLDEDKFLISETEKNSILTALEDSGRMLINSEVKFVDFRIKRYTINVILKCFEMVDKEQIRDTVRSKLNDFYLSINRFDMIPKSDLIAIIESIDGVDSCDVFFITQANEANKIAQRNARMGSAGIGVASISNKDIIDNRIGFDEVGNLITSGKNTIYLPRGGWRDYNGNYFEPCPTTGKLSNLNVIFLNDVEYNSYNLKQQKELHEILKNSYK